MRQIIIASHAHFAGGIYEAVELLSGAHANVRVLNMFVDGNNDVEAAAAAALDACAGEETIVCTDLLGGSVNSEFTKLVQGRENVHLLTNMNLALLMQLLFADEDRSCAEIVRELAASDDCRVKYVNDLLAESDEADDDF